MIHRLGQLILIFFQNQMVDCPTKLHIWILMSNFRGIRSCLHKLWSIWLEWTVFLYSNRICSKHEFAHVWMDFKAHTEFQLPIHVHKLVNSKPFTCVDNYICWFFAYQFWSVDHSRFIHFTDYHKLIAIQLKCGVKIVYESVL